MDTIRIFIASSSELAEDRKEFRDFLSVENDRLHKKGVYLKLEQWENVLDTVSKTSLQDEYNIELKKSQIVVCLFYTKAGKYTQEEFDTALRQFKETGSPLIYTYFKTGAPEPDPAVKFEMDLVKFKKRLSDIGHFYTSYDNIDDLKYQFRKQLDRLEDKGFIVLQQEVQKQTEKNVTSYYNSKYAVTGDISASRDIIIGDKTIINTYGFGRVASFIGISLMVLLGSIFLVKWFDNGQVEIELSLHESEGKYNYLYNTIYSDTSKVDDGVDLHVSYSNPYLTKLLDSGVISTVFIPEEYPVLSVQSTNTTKNPVLLTKLAIEVQESNINIEPIPGVKREPPYGDLDVFWIENEGWGKLINARLNFDILELSQFEEGCPSDPVARLNYPFSLDLGNFSSDRRVDVSSFVEDSLRMGNEHACVTGQLNYLNEDGLKRQGIFNVKIRIVPYTGSVTLPPFPPDTIYSIFLEAGKSGYKTEKKISYSLPSGKSDHFEIKLHTDKSSNFLFKLSLLGINGKKIHSSLIRMDMLVPVRKSNTTEWIDTSHQIQDVIH